METNPEDYQYGEYEDVDNEDFGWDEGDDNGDEYDDEDEDDVDDDDR